MFDLRIQKSCTHELFDQPATVQGLSPNYFSILDYQSDSSSGFITVRDAVSTEGLSSFIYSRDGFTNWSLSADGRQLNWNSLGLGGPGTGVASFLDAASHILPQPELLISYRTKADLCPLCANSLNLTKDIEFDQHGKLRTLTGINKIKHLLFKALLTETGSNEILTEYGSTLSSAIGQKLDDYTQFLMYNAIQTTVQYILEEQANNPNLAADETLMGLSAVQMVRDFVDPRIVRVLITIQTADFKKTDVTFAMTTN